MQLLVYNYLFTTTKHNYKTYVSRLAHNRQDPQPARPTTGKDRIEPHEQHELRNGLIRDTWEKLRFLGCWEPQGLDRPTTSMNKEVVHFSSNRRGRFGRQELVKER